jgi:hypothetical protein
LLAHLWFVVYSKHFPNPSTIILQEGDGDLALAAVPLLLRARISLLYNARAS